MLGHGWPGLQWLLAGVQRGPSCGPAAGWCQSQFHPSKKNMVYSILLPTDVFSEGQLSRGETSRRGKTTHSSS